VVADIMSRDVICVDEDADLPTARALLLDHEVRSLPVLDQSDRLVGTLGLRELSHPGIRIRDLMSEARTATPDTPAIRLVEPLTDGRTHSVTIVDEDRRVIGIVTQTDLLAAVLRSVERIPASVE
jgi:CBS domain-containing membrane protein